MTGMRSEASSLSIWSIFSVSLSLSASLSQLSGYDKKIPPGLCALLCLATAFLDGQYTPQTGHHYSEPFLYILGQNIS